QVNIGLTLDGALIGRNPFASFGVDWTASERAVAVFSYLEAEDLNVAATDFATSLTVDQMPTRETFSFSFKPATGITISHRGNAPIDHVLFEHQRRDGMVVKVSADQVP